MSLFSRRQATADQPTATATIAAAVDSQSRPYTDPRATYPAAVAHRDARRQSTPRRKDNH